MRHYAPNKLYQVTLGSDGANDAKKRTCTIVKRRKDKCAAKRGGTDNSRVGTEINPLRRRPPEKVRPVF